MCAAAALRSDVRALFLYVCTMVSGGKLYPARGMSAALKKTLPSTACLNAGTDTCDVTHVHVWSRHTVRRGGLHNHGPSPSEHSGPHA
eukprot:21465-Eustigmatos_ZCMA.PRE.1